MKPYIKRIIGVSCLLMIIISCVVVALFVYILGGTMGSLTDAIVDIDRYNEILEGYAENAGIQHFPTTLPLDASDIHFYYLPRFLQGGNILQLRLKRPINEILLEKERYKSQVLYSFPNGSFNSQIPLPSLRAGSGESNSFPETFEIIVLGAEPAGNDEFQWNHGTIFGLAVDEENSEIIYWYEWW